LLRARFWGDAMCDTLSIQALGHLQITCGGHALTEFDSKKVAALLVYLACTGRTHPREVLAEFFWEGRTQSQSLANLRVALTSLRKTVGDYVTITRETVSLKEGSAIWLDVATFEEALSAGELEQAVDLYQGDFLTGFYVDSQAFEDWALRERERLRLRMHEAVDALIDQYLNQGDYAKGIAHATHLLSLDPLREKTYHHLMRLLADSGEREAALAQYDALTRRLDEELGVEPTPETQALYEQIRIGQLGRSTSPRPHGPSPDPPRHNLPSETTSFIGREADIEAITMRLRGADCRLITLLGPGGIGKTRLALAVAHHLAEAFADGVWFVPLATIEDPAYVAGTIAKALEVRETAGQFAQESLKGHLSTRELLLVLDNFEQIIDAAPLVSRLLAAAPGLTILVTSREVLRLSGEQVYAVPSLEIPATGEKLSLEAISECEASRLFIERTMLGRTTFELTETDLKTVAEICVRLEGIPLAIELAAARTRMLTLETLLKRLESRLQILTAGPRDAPTRQQTLRNTIAWSHDLLAGDEQILFARLGVFAGGCTLEAVDAICGPGLAMDVLAGLESLLDKSLLGQAHGLAGETRVWMLETLREYALEQLEARDELVVIQRQHAHYFLTLISQDSRIYALDDTARNDLWRRLEADLENIRATLTWMLDTGALKHLDDCVETLSEFWNIHGFLEEGRQWLGRALAHGANLPASARGKALSRAGWFAARQSDYAQAETLHQQALTVAQEMGDKGRIAFSRYSLAVVMAQTGRLDCALMLAEQAREAYQQLGIYNEVASVLNFMGEVARFRGDLERARTFYEEALLLADDDDTHFVKSGLHYNLGWVALHQGNIAEAHTLFEYALRRKLDTGNVLGLPDSCLSQAALALVDERSEQAVRLLGVAAGLLGQSGYRFSDNEQTEFDRCRTSVQQMLSAEAFETLWTEGHSLSRDDAIALLSEACGG